MINFEGRLSVIVADILLQLGKYSKMMEYVKLAESILTDFDEPFLMGKLEFMKSHNCLNKGNVESAFRHIDSCIDLFDVAEQRPFLIEAYIHKIEILIEKNEFSLAKRVISKIELLNKKLQDAPERPLLEIFKLLHSPDKIERDNIRQIQKQISTTIPAEQILCYWHLTNIFKKIGELKAAENCLTKALELINQQALINSKVEDQNSYRNQVNLHKNIKEKLRIFQGRALA
jgi:tetratricopeptide (TPR) repeat protein